MRVRSSVKWTALTGVTPGRNGSSVNGAVRVTVAVNDWTTLRPPGSAAVTRIVALPMVAAARFTRAPAVLAATTFGATDDAE